jgi:hypothetical protein
MISKRHSRDAPSSPTTQCNQYTIWGKKWWREKRKTLCYVDHEKRNTFSSWRRRKRDLKLHSKKQRNNIY